MTIRDFVSEQTRGGDRRGFLSDIIYGNAKTETNRLFERLAASRGVEKAEVFSDADREAILASYLWQIVAAAFPMIMAAPQGPGNGTSSELLIVPHGVPSAANFDLVVMTDGGLNSTYVTDLQKMWFNRPGFDRQDRRHYDYCVQLWAFQNYQRTAQLVGERRITPQQAAVRTAPLNSIDPRILEFFVEAVNPRIIAVPRPEMAATSVPAKPLRITSQTTSPTDSTAGAVVTDAAGRAGVTCCRHAMVSAGQTAPLNGTTVDVHGTGGTILADHLITDSCFVECQTSHLSLRKTNGPLRGVTPRLYDQCTFDGLVSGTGQQAVIQAFSPDITMIDPANQVKVLTDPVTKPGDSGAALVDSQDNILGFAFQRTRNPLANPAFATWIWAESVYTALQVT